MIVDHEKLTAAELEEKIEFIDFSLVPERLITQKLADKFPTFLEIKSRITLDRSFKNISHCETKPYEIFFFDKKGKWQMTLHLNSGSLLCSEDLWDPVYSSLISRDLNNPYDKTQMYIRNAFNSFKKKNYYTFEHPIILPVKRMRSDYEHILVLNKWLYDKISTNKMSTM